MLDFLEAQELYFKGKDYLNLKDYFNAIDCFNKAALNEKLKVPAYCMLVEIYIKLSNFAKAQEFLSKIEEKNDYCYFLQATIDFYEYNFQSSINNYANFSNIDYQSHNLLRVARCYFNLGEVDMAIKMLETSALYENTKLKSILELIIYFIFMHDYNYAYKLFQKLDSYAPNKKIQKRYSIFGLEKYLKYQLGIISKIDDIYFLHRYICDDDEVLIKHLQEHIERTDNESMNYFFKYTDLKALIDDVKQKIANLNYLTSETLSKRYNFPTNSIIGYNNEELAKDLCVVTTPNNHIITMYPIYLSSAYNAEGYGTSRELALKRCQRGIK